MPPRAASEFDSQTIPAPSPAGACARRARVIAGLKLEGAALTAHHGDDVVSEIRGTGWSSLEEVGGSQPDAGPRFAPHRSRGGEAQRNPFGSSGLGGNLAAASATCARTRPTHRPAPALRQPDPARRPGHPGRQGQRTLAVAGARQDTHSAAARPFDRHRPWRRQARRTRRGPGRGGGPRQVADLTHRLHGWLGQLDPPACQPRRGRCQPEPPPPAWLEMPACTTCAGLTTDDAAAAVPSPSPASPGSGKSTLSRPRRCQGWAIMAACAGPR